jgi:putative photosynthetic complex assembly protein
MHDLAHAHSSGHGPGYGRRPRTREDVMIPRIILRALLGLILFSFAAVLVARTTGYGLMLTPESVAAETRLLHFDEGSDGVMVVRDHESGAEVALFPEGEGGFIRGVLRGLTRGRALERMEAGDVFLLTRWEDGRLSISDPVTGERFDLNSFGVDNLRIFAQLLKSQEEVR